MARMEEGSGVHEVLVGKSEGKNHWEDLQEVGGGGTDLIDLTQERDRWRALVNTIMNLQVP